MTDDESGPRFKTVTYARHSMGIEYGRHEWCSTCGKTANQPTCRLNIDGVWSYLCLECQIYLIHLLLEHDDAAKALAEKEPATNQQ